MRMADGMAYARIGQVGSTGRLLAVLAGVILAAAPASGLSTDRAANIFGGDEEFIVLSTTVTGTAQWQLTNDYGEAIQGVCPVTDGRIRIPIGGLRFGRYTIEVARDGKIVGGVVPPAVELTADLRVPIFQGPAHWRNPEEGLMWQQLGVGELRFEFGLTNFNPEPGKYVFDPAIDAYFKALSGPRRPAELQDQRPAGVERFQHRPGQARRAEGLPRLRGHVDGLREHYRPLGIDRYYIINEPEAGGWWSAGWEGYYRFLQSCDCAIKKADARMLTIAPESWSYVPEFLDKVLQTGSVDIVSGHYPADTITDNVHSGFFFTAMRRTGVWRPFINGEDQCWQHNFGQPEWAKFYAGPAGTGWAIGETQMMNLDLNAYRVVMLQESWNKNAMPFASYEAGKLSPTEACFQLRAVSDELAGAQVRCRLPQAPPHVLGWLYRRGTDNFLGAYTAEGKVTQLVEIATRGAAADRGHVRE